MLGNVKSEWTIPSVPQNDVALPSSDNCQRKQLDLYVANDVYREIVGNAGSGHGFVDIQT